MARRGLTRAFVPQEGAASGAQCPALPRVRQQFPQRHCQDLLERDLGSASVVSQPGELQRCPDLRRQTSQPPRERLGQPLAAVAGDQVRAGEAESLDDRHLGEPGVFIGYAVLAWTNWQNIGHASVVEHVAWSDTPLPGMVPPAEAARRLLAHVTASLAAAIPGFYLFIIHDAILFPTIARTLPGVDNRRWWPGYLEAAVVWLDPEGRRFAYREVQLP